MIGLPAALGDGTAEFPYRGAGGFASSAQRTRIHVVGLLVNVHEFRSGAGLRDSFGGGDEGVGHGQNAIARLDAGRHQRETQSVGAAVDRDAMLGIAELGERLLEALNLRTADESRAAQRLARQYCYQFFLHLHMRSDQIQKRDIHFHCNFL